MYALVRIGAPSVTALVSEQYADSPWYVRNYSNSILGDVHHDNSVSYIVELIPHEDDGLLRGQLGIALVSHFDDSAIEPAVALYDEDPNDLERFPMIERLFAQCCLAGLDLPRKDEWREQIEAYWQQFEQQSDDSDEYWESLSEDDDFEDEDFSEDDFEGDDEFLTDRILGLSKPSDQKSYRPKSQPIVRETRRVGRNERCPWGSGKKYKNCCLRNTPK